MHHHDHSGHDHSHDHSGHSHDHRGMPTRRLAIALGITAVFLVAEVIGGLLTNSLALLADAGHMATDAASLGLALFAAWLARRPATPARSFGYHRAEVLAALANAVSLVVIAVVILWEAVHRLNAPPEVDSLPMLAVAVAGLLANVAAAWVLSRGGDHKHNLNTRGAFLHVIQDMLGSAAAIAAAIVMYFTGWFLADPILSALIGLLILRGAWRFLADTTNVLMEATPAHLDAEAIGAAMREVNGVAGIHDLHIWTVTSGFIALSGHVETTGKRPWKEVLVDEATLLREQFGITHITLQPEPAAGTAPITGCTAGACVLAATEAHAH